MRLLALALALALTVVLVTGVSSRATQAAESMHGRSAAIAMQQKPPVENNDDTRVPVQLLVLGLAAGIVVGLGSAAYVLRKRLGLVPPPPAQTGDHH